MLARTLVVASIIWPLGLGAACAHAAAGGATTWAAVTYAAASVVCHQQSDRSFHTGGVKWPVCARCSGLYLAAPFGALAALLAASPRPRRRAAVWVAAAAVPTAATWLLEWSGALPMTNAARAVAALPLGALVGAVLVATVRGGRA
jgi:uncharacterized membrane protein